MAGVVFEQFEVFRSLLLINSVLESFYLIDYKKTL